MHTLLLKFAGPLQSWGTKSHFENRHTDLYPSKSAVIGIIAACMGLRRDQDEQINKLNEISFAVREDQKGGLLRDYHIAKKIKPNGEFERNYVTNRYYLEDAIFVVAIGHENKDFIDVIEESLKNPYFQPYLGRRSLPINNDFILYRTEIGVIESLEKCPWKASNWYMKRSNNKLNIYADYELVKADMTNIRSDRVKSFSFKERKFINRLEGHIEMKVEAESIDTSHDIFRFIGD